MAPETFLLLVMGLGTALIVGSFYLLNYYTTKYIVEINFGLSFIEFLKTKGSNTTKSKLEGLKKDEKFYRKLILSGSKTSFIFVIASRAKLFLEEELNEIKKYLDEYVGHFNQIYPELTNAKRNIERLLEERKKAIPKGKRLLVEIYDGKEIKLQFEHVFLPYTIEVTQFLIEKLLQYI